MFRYFIYLAYDGTNYHGWQMQPNGVSVQETLVKALVTFLRDDAIGVTGAGRTDAGVHARLMVAHFDLEWMADPDLMADKLNRILPYRTYKYYVTIRKDPFNRMYVWRIFQRLDFGRMNEAARTLLEYTDFTSFSKLHTDVKTNNCRIMQAVWEQTGEDEWVFTIQADRFLRNMVRAIVGTLVEVGRGKLSVEGFRQIIEKKDRCSAGTSAPGNALFLVDIGYPDDLFVDCP